MSKTTTRGLPAIISSQDMPLWESCRIITPNLLSAYYSAIGKENLQVFSYTEEMLEGVTSFRHSQIIDLAQRIYDSRPEKLIFIDHSPHPFPLLLALAEVYHPNKLPPLYFHVFGDFTLKAPWWLEAASLLKQTRVMFVCASGRQSGLVSRLLNRPEFSLDVCPFPVDTEHYQANGTLRKTWRKKLGLKKDEFAIVYSGRVSLQKNVMPTAREVAYFMERSGIPSQFFIAGRFDDLGAPLFGVQQRQGSCFQQWQRVLAELAPETRERIHHLGHLSSDELVGLYNAADTYVSLSVHHDEDFGMAPAEALCSGAPAILSSWGGYSGFVSHVDSDCRLVSINIEPQGGLQVEWDQFHRYLFMQSLEDTKIEKRQQRAKRYEARFSIAAAAEVIKALHKKPLQKFEGFNQLFRDLAKQSLQNPVYPTGAVRNSLYEAIYGPYMGEVSTRP